MRTVIAVAAYVLLCTSQLAATGFTLTEPGLAPGPLWAAPLAIATNDSHQLAVWREEGRALKAAVLDLDGRLLSDRSFHVDEAISPHTLQLFGTGDTFTLIATEGSSTLWLQLDSTGRVLDRRRVDDLGFPLTPFVWNGRQFGVVVSRAGKIQAQLHDLDGSLRHGPFDLDSRAETFGVYAVADQILIGSDRSLRVLTTSGVLPVAATRVSRIFTAVDAGDGWLVASTEGGAAGGARLVVQHVSSSVVGEKNVVAEANALAPLAFLETAGGYSLVFDTYASVDSVLLNRAGELVDGSRSTRLHRHALAADADADSIAVLTSSPVNGLQQITATQLGPHFTLRSVPVSKTLARQTNPVGAVLAGTALIAFNELRFAPVIQVVTLRDRRPRLVGSIEGSRIVARSLPSNGREALLLHHSGTNLFATRLAPDAARLGENSIVLSTTATSPEASAVWTGTEWAIVWLDAEDSQAVRLASLNGTDIEERRPIKPYPRSTSGSYQLSTLELHAMDAGFAVSWEEVPICSMPCIGPEAVVAIVDSNGSPRAISRFELPSSTSDTASDGESVVLVEGGEALVLEPVTDGLAVRRDWTLREWDAATRIIWDGDEYVVGAAYTLTTLKVAIDRFTGESERSQRKVMNRLHDFAAAPTIVPLSVDEALLLIEELTPDGRRVVAYLESDMMPAPEPPARPTSLRTREGAHGATTWEWDPPVNGVVDGYVAEVVYGAWSNVQAVLPPETRQFTSLSNVRIRAFNDGGFSPLRPHARQRPGALR